MDDFLGDTSAVVVSLPGPRPITPFFNEGHFMGKNMFFLISAQSKVNIDIKVYIFEFLISSATTLNWKFLTSLNRLHIIEFSLISLVYCYAVVMLTIIIILLFDKTAGFQLVIHQ